MATLLGFAPSFRAGTANTVSDTNITVGAGSINAVLVGLVKVAIGAVTGTFYVFVDNSGNITVSTNPAGGINLVCTVVIGPVVTSGTESTATGTLSPLVPGNVAPPPSTNLTFSQGIVSLTDNRAWK